MMMMRRIMEQPAPPALIRFIVVVVVVVVVYGSIACSPCVSAVKYNKVHVVDYDVNSSGFLFRCDMPLNDSVSYSDCGVSVPLWNCFGYRETVGFMAKRAVEEAHGVALPDTFWMRDISLLDISKPDEKAFYSIEQAFFRQFPEKGSVENWRVRGETTDPSKYTLDQLKAKVQTYESWAADPMDKWLTILHESFRNATNGQSGPTVVLLHCSHGADRTGQLSAGYAMKYQNTTWVTAMKNAYSIAGRPITKENQNAAQWYCSWLQYAKGYENLGCLDPVPASSMFDVRG
jgi:protein-tyrosine phosphatase